MTAFDIAMMIIAGATSVNTGILIYILWRLVTE